MQKRMLLVQPTERGWAVSFRGLPLSTEETETAAVEVAQAHARDRYGVTGEPIGVVLRRSCGDEVLVSQHG
jgi:hypothetical protein